MPPALYHASYDPECPTTCATHLPLLLRGCALPTTWIPNVSQLFLLAILSRPGVWTIDTACICRIIAKAASSYLQMCGGQISGIQAAVHVRSTLERKGDILVDVL